MPRFSSLGEWLAWQETLHPKEVDLGLERVELVYGRMGAIRPAPVVISVAGTNGKGSSVAMLDAIYLAQGYRTGRYTSPHLLRYNERICVDGIERSDLEICAAFDRVDIARGNLSLSYFEFGTLAALDIFQCHELDVVLLEVGLGGRLDAVNIIDADAALVTSIGIDHIEWLGKDRESIGREKAGIFRAGRPAVCADPVPPESLEQVAEEKVADWLALGQHFHFEVEGRCWHWSGPDGKYDNLPRPAIPGGHQLVNAAGVLMVLQSLSDRLLIKQGSIEEGLRSVCLPARAQRIEGAVEQILDVAHNTQSAGALAKVLAGQDFFGRTLAVLGMMADKDCVGFVSALSDMVDAWYVTGLAVERAAKSDELSVCVKSVVKDKTVISCEQASDAYREIFNDAQPGDRIVVCGSFYTLSEWMDCSKGN